MGCNCKWFEKVVAVVVLVIAIWPNFLGAAAPKWVLIIAAVALFLHAVKCKNCGVCEDGNMSSMPVKRATKKKKRK